MAAKQLIFREEARDNIRRGVDALAEAAKVTLGPRRRTVILEREFDRRSVGIREVSDLGRHSATQLRHVDNGAILDRC